MLPQFHFRHAASAFDGMIRLPFFDAADGTPPTRFFADAAFFFAFENMRYHIIMRSSAEKNIIMLSHAAAKEYMREVFCAPFASL